MDAEQEKLYGAREGIDRTLQRLETIEAPKSEVAGGDTRKVVRATVAPDGRVRSIVVDHRWQEAVAPAELAGAIVEAYLVAGASRIEDWVGDVDEAFAMPEPRNRPFPQAIADHFGALPSGQPLTEDAVLRELTAVWGEIEAELDHAIDHLSERVESTHRVSSHGGDVSVEVTSSGALVDLKLREAWLTRAHPANIGRTVLATIEQAQHEAIDSFAGVKADARASTEALARLGDPTTIGRRLGLEL